jgi:hypothetical protein
MATSGGKNGKETSWHSFCLCYYSASMAATDIPAWTVLDASIECGVDKAALFLGETQARHIADDILMMSFRHAWTSRTRNWMTSARRSPTCL